MNSEILRYLQTITDAELAIIASQLLHRLQQELHVAMAGSRARALLLATNALDETLLRDFSRLMSQAKAVRVALYDLLESGDLQTISTQLSPIATHNAPAANWLTLGISVYAYKIGYPLENLDPTTPPQPFSPAGQVVQQTGQWIKRQVQRTATDRDKLARKLAYVASTPNPPQAPTAPTAAPRTPVPVRYFEFNEEVEVSAENPPPPPPPSNHLTISVSDIPPEPPPLPPLQPLPPPEPPLNIVVGEARQVSRPAPPSRSRPEFRLPDAITDSVDRMVAGIRSTFAGEEMQQTRLRVTVEEYPTGPGLPAVQVKVRYRDSKSDVAGTTNAEGIFLCSLPVRPNSGITYEVDVIWPLAMGGQTEQKLITLNADRSEFLLPFYSRLGS